MTYATGDPMAHVPVEIRCERFPVLSQTFVANEARTLADLGHTVTIHAHERGREPLGGSIDPHLPATYREDDTRATRARAVLRLALLHPIRVVRDIAARRRWRREEAVAPLRVLAPAMLRWRARPAHLHVHFAKESALDALRAQRIVGSAFTLTAHAYDIYSQPANLTEKLRAASVVTTGCEYTAADLRAAAPDADVRVVIMGVDVEEFRRSRPHPERRVVVAVGRLVDKKGFVDLVRAAAVPALAGLVDEVRIVGDGPLRPALAAEIAALGLEGVVHLVGEAAPSGVRTELEGAAVLAVPCVVAPDGDRDSMPVVIKEALAMEVPVVGTDVAGLPEILRPPFGWLVPPDDPAALAAALAEVLRLPVTERAGRGAAGRTHVAEHAALLTETTKLGLLFALSA